MAICLTAGFTLGLSVFVGGRAKPTMTGKIASTVKTRSKIHGPAAVAALIEQITAPPEKGELLFQGYLVRPDSTIVRP